MHTERNVAETGLGTLLELLTNVQKCDVGMINAFYQSYYLGLLQDVFSVLTDSLHKPGFKLHAMLLAHLFNAVESNTITTPLWPQDGTVQASTTASTCATSSSSSRSSATRPTCTRTSRRRRTTTRPKTYARGKRPSPACSTRTLETTTA